MRKWVAGAAIAAALCAAEVPNLTGTWRLNVDKSSWGKKTKPTLVVIQMEHQEPALKYTGKETGTDGEEKSFSFAGAIDGKSYPVNTSYGPGKVIIKRVNDYTFSSEFKSDDGRYTEDATTSLSHDQKVLTRRVRLKSPDGAAAWTEVYEKQQ